VGLEQAAPEVEETRLSVLFKGIAGAVSEGRLAVAARLAESARRFAPAHPTVIQLHSCLLLRTGAAAAAADSIRGRDEPDSVILLVEAAQAAGRPDEAADACRSLLTHYALDAVPDLYSTAGRLCRSSRDRFPGWVGIDSALRLIGEVASPGELTIEHADRRLRHVVAPVAPNFPAAWSVTLRPDRAGPIRVRLGQHDLLGSGLRWPPEFGMSGWVVLEEGVLSGEVCLEWAPRMAIELLVARGADHFKCTVNPTARGAIGWSFAFPLPFAGGEDVHVDALLPDGRRVPLAGSPLRMRDDAPCPIGLRPVRPRLAPRLPITAVRVNVVVPIYAGLQDTMTCLNSVLATIDAQTTVVTVVDDASPDDALCAAVDALAAQGRVKVLRNERNLGFPGAANRGMRAHPDKDAVLLNSDTEVFESWLDRLMAVAYSSGDIGTVTPFGGAASIVAFADGASGPLSSQQARRIDKIAQAVNRDMAIEIPVGVGFCLYVRRPCLDEVGEFDERRFGRGYGEENDLCLRARRRGWRHVAAPGLYVRHAGGRSYGAAKRLLSVRNARVVNYRHPGYDRLIADFIAADPLRGARRAIEQRLLIEDAERPVLLLSVDLPGGVKRHVDERQAALRQLGHTVLLLQAEERSDRCDGVILAVAGSDFQNLTYSTDEIPELRRLLDALGLVQIEIHHFLGLSDVLLEMVVRLGVPYRAYVHDYAWICPRVSLLSGDGIYCREPPLAACEACVRDHGSAFPVPITVSALRARSAAILEGAEAIVAPTRDARDRIVRHFPAVPVAVTPWETVRPPPRRAAAGVGHVRVALIGAIGTSKGYAILLACARDAAARNLPLEFVVIGYTRDDRAVLDTGRVFVTGPYEEHAAAALLRREECDIAFFPSQTPETWCYTLTYALAENLPIVAMDVGAVAERLRDAGAGLLLPLETTPAAANAALLRHAAEARQAAEAKSLTHVHTRSIAHTMQTNPPSDLVQDTGSLAASVQVLALPVGIYAFTVSGGGMAPNGGLALPALQVAPAPMRSSATIEFLQGPDTVDRWLTRTGDVLTVRISGGEMTLLLTSLRAPDSSVLSIDIRRLDTSMPAEIPPPIPPRASVLVHVQNVGDLEFTEGWAGGGDDNLWVEAFSIVPQEPPTSDLLEYRALTHDGAATDWLRGGALCGSRGAGLPLTGFAVRVNRDAAERYTCTYSGRFQSGAVSGPYSDGSFCRSDVPEDPLVALEVRIEEHASGEASV
jgi:GT2 family glycosyltransferase/glycosyltransferase involved in cell wall biosynthesis